MWHIDNTEADYYGILGVSREATDEEIKQGYKSAILGAHPDKAQAMSGHEQASENIKRIREAYGILKNAETRAAYDKEIGRREAYAHVDDVYVHIQLSDMDRCDGSCRYPCRCGDTFVIEECDIRDIGNDTECILQCPSCSLMAHLAM
ncbi:Diphthamide biosynthesis protein 4 [Picochlorum sp. SENEW3]|nr:Diphthamide biosynthesis protein 4 [Picochlorum sp. SENEW3]WPT15934.1 Diphthamide biosynthesis protein 4 [Picochlorum sp. SENEW3]